MPLLTRNLRTRPSTIAGLSPASSKAIDGPRVKRGSCHSSSRLGRAAEGLKAHVGGLHAVSAGQARRCRCPVPRRGYLRLKPRSHGYRRQSGRGQSGSLQAFGQSVDDAGGAEAGSSSRTERAVGPVGSSVIIQQSSGSTPRTRSAHSTRHSAVAAPVVGDAEVFKGLRTLQPVRVEMVNRAVGLRTRGSRRTWGSRSPPDRPPALRRWRAPAGSCPHRAGRPGR